MLKQPNGLILKGFIGHDITFSYKISFTEAFNYVPRSLYSNEFVVYFAANSEIMKFDVFEAGNRWTKIQMDNSLLQIAVAGGEDGVAFTVEGLEGSLSVKMFDDNFEALTREL